MGTQAKPEPAVVWHGFYVQVEVVKLHLKAS